MSTDNYWVGRRKSSGAMWLHDSRLEHHDPEMIYAFYAKDGTVREYERRVVKDRLEEVTDQSRDSVIAAYETWYQKYGTNFAEGFRQRKALKLAEQKELIAKRHRDYVIDLGKPYLGVRAPSINRHRLTRCHSCKQKLDSDRHLECKACNWIICNCGACGCGYPLIEDEF